MWLDIVLAAGCLAALGMGWLFYSTDKRRNRG